MLLGLTVALFQDSPAQGQTATGAILQVVPTPNENSNSELLAASASSPNDIWAVGQSTIHFDGTTWTAFPAPMIKGDNNSFLQGVVAISPTLAWAAGNVTDGAHPGQVIEQWNGTKWSLFPGPKFGKKDQANVFAMTASSANDVWAIGSLVNLGTGDWSRRFSSTGTARHGRRQLGNRTMSFCLARPPTPRMMPGRWDSTVQTTSKPQRCTGMARTGRVWQLPT